MGYLDGFEIGWILTRMPDGRNDAEHSRLAVGSLPYSVVWFRKAEGGARFRRIES